MTTPRTLRLFGFFRPLYRGAGLAIPVFGTGQELFVQVVEHETVAGFVLCDVAAPEVLGLSDVDIVMSGPAPRVTEVEPSLERSVGEPAWYAFQVDSKRVLLDARSDLIAAITHVTRDWNYAADPFLALDIAEFSGDAKRAHAARLLTRRLLEPNERRQRTARIIVASRKGTTKSALYAQISKDTHLTKKQVGAVFDSLGGVMRKSLRSTGLFAMPGLVKMKVVKRPNTRAREGINPFTGEKRLFKVKPASKRIKITLGRALRELKTR